jgi:hypothetical protein
VLAYISDGHRLDEWSGGKVAHGRVELVSRQGVRLNAWVERRAVRGTLTLPGCVPRAFSADPLPSP